MMETINENEDGNSQDENPYQTSIPQGKRK
jgi:hypothetical protein